MKHHVPLETRSAVPLETRDENNDDPLAAATQAVDELRTGFETFRTSTDERIATELRGVTERLQGLETRLNRPGAGGQQERQDDNAVERRAFVGFVRHGRETLPDIEARALRVSDQPSGGYLAPDQFEAVLLRELVEVSPIRTAARVTQTSAGAVIMPRRTGTLTAKWVGETETRPGTEPTYGQVEIPVHEMACWVDVSNRLLEDSAINIEDELAFDFAEEFGRLEGEAFVFGDGVKKPIGIMSDAGVTAVPNGNATTLAPDSLIRLMYDLPAQYRNRGSWLLNGGSIATVRLIKDSNGRFLWQESLAEGQPPTLLGRPVIEAPDMPDIAADAFPIAYGDFGAGYRILDRIGLSVLRDPYTQQTNGIVRFHARRRVGAGVVRPEAIRKLRMATS
jgi:HK97 family phage major capsid protein